MSGDYYKNLPKKRMAVGMLFFNVNNELLIVKPGYKDWWSIPGGVVEQDESPRVGCIREVKEEIGLDVTPLDLLCVDWTSPMPEKGDAVQVIFYGGILNDAQISAIKLAPEEIIDYCFMPVDDAVPKLGDKLRRRVPKCIEALKSGISVYLEDGELVL